MHLMENPNIQALVDFYNSDQVKNQLIEEKDIEDMIKIIQNIADDFGFKVYEHTITDRDKNIAFIRDENDIPQNKYRNLKGVDARMTMFFTYDMTTRYGLQMSFGDFDNNSETEFV